MEISTQIPSFTSNYGWFVWYTSHNTETTSHSVSAYLQSFDGNTSTNTSGGLPFGEYATINSRNSSWKDVLDQATFLWPVKVGTAHQVQSCSARSACRRYRRIGSIHWLFVAEDACSMYLNAEELNTTRLLVWFRQHILNRMIFCLSCFKTPALLAENLYFCTLSQSVY